MEKELCVCGHAFHVGRCPVYEHDNPHGSGDAQQCACPGYAPESLREVQGLPPETPGVIATPLKRVFPSGAQRGDRRGKGRFDLLSPLALRRLARHFENGAVHYGDRNWEKGQPLSGYLDSAMRHINDLREGLKDEDHAAAAEWNIHCFIHTQEAIARGLLGAELDDLPSYTREAGEGGGT